MEKPDRKKIIENLRRVREDIRKDFDKIVNNLYEVFMQMDNYVAYFEKGLSERR